jgi:glycosyltransferase involved in cell wall biosynthesis
MWWNQPMKINSIGFSILLLLVLFSICFRFISIPLVNKENFTEKSTDILNQLNQDRQDVHFPYRYLCDEQQQILPLVLVSGFFRDDSERERFDYYEANGVKLAGITAYKSFPRPITDGTGDTGTANDSFDYYNRIKDWFCCFGDPTQYGFDSSHRLLDISESDFYDADTEDPVVKKYDFIYVCLKDDDECSANGWNAVNRNFTLALKCLPIMLKEYGMKGLIVGRVGCGLEKQYGDQIEVIDFLPYHEFQEKIRESRFLFITNIYDASPRVVAEALIKDVPVLMNRQIVCGSKYIQYETGELFTDEHDLRLALDRFLGKRDLISPKAWWIANHSRKKAGKKMRDFLAEVWPEHVGNAEEIYFM